ncbi:hypothetical protein WA158_002910 [Blastocystis sp. Blastoise]
MGADIKIRKSTYVCMIIIGCILQAFNGFIDYSRSILFDSIKTLFTIDDTTLSLISSSLGYSMILFCFAATMILDKWGMKPVQIIGIVAWLISFFGMWMWKTFAPVVTFLVFMWLGTSFVMIGVNAVGTTVFVRNPALMVGILNFAAGIGGILCPFIYNPILNAFDNDFTYIYVFFAIPCILFLIFILFVRYEWTIIPDRSEMESNTKVNPFAVFKDPLFYVFLILVGCMQQIHFMTIDWSLIYLKNYLSWDGTKGATFITIYSATFTAGRLIYSAIGGKIGSFNYMMFTTFCATLFATIGLCFTNDGAFVISIIGLFTGPFFPVMVTMAIDVWGTGATIASSYLITLYSIIKELLNVSVGVINDKWGTEWGFRMMVPIGIVQLIIVICIKCVVNKREQDKKNKKLRIHKDIESNVTEEKFETDIDNVTIKSSTETLNEHLDNNKPNHNEEEDKNKLDNDDISMMHPVASLAQMKDELNSKPETPLPEN